MSLQYPLKLDRAIFLDGENGRSGSIMLIEEGQLGANFEFVDSSGQQMKINGYDSSDENDRRGLRVTNLCAIRNGQLIKKCPRCGVETDFFDYGPAFRSTNERRDQSDCMDCRHT